MGGLSSQHVSDPGKTTSYLQKTGVPRGQYSTNIGTKADAAAYRKAVSTAYKMVSSSNKGGVETPEGYKPFAGKHDISEAFAKIIVGIAAVSALIAILVLWITGQLTPP